MLKSKFKFRAKCPYSHYSLNNYFNSYFNRKFAHEVEQIRWIDVYMSILFLFTWIYLLFGIFRTQIIEITINIYKSKRKNYLGFENYDFQYFDGFQTSIEILNLEILNIYI
jgi:hypothetical protein